MPFPFKLPLDSEPVIREVGWPRSLCIAMAILCLVLVTLIILNTPIIGG